MKKLIIASFVLCALLYTGSNIHAQGANKQRGLIVKKKDASKSHTPKNVLKWAKESKQLLEKMAIKLDKVKPTNDKDKKTLLMIHSAQQRITLIIQQGKKLKPKDAREHDQWFRQKMAESLEECLGQNPGSECCFSCPNGSGWGNFWCKTNCFVFSIPGS